jgi:hypothetical protein
MKKILWSALFLLSIMAVSCNSNKRNASDSLRKSHVTPDTTDYVVLSKIVGDSIYTKSLNGNKENVFFSKPALVYQEVFGSLTQGDTLAIVGNQTSKNLISSVNLSEMLGLWMTDGNTEGMRLSFDGGAASVNMNDVALKSWDLYNGRFIMTYVRSQDANAKEISDTSKIEYLSRKAIKIKFNRKDYTMQHPTLIKLRRK